MGKGINLAKAQLGEYRKKQLRAALEARGFDDLRIMCARRFWAYLPFVGPRTHPNDRTFLDYANFCAALQASGIKLTARRTDCYNYPLPRVYAPLRETMAILEVLCEAKDAPGLKEMSIMELISIALAKE